MKVGIIIGSIREGRFGEAVGQWVKQRADTRTGNIKYQLVDLKEFNVPLLDSPVIPGAANKKYDNEQVQAWSAIIDDCDGYVFITPEYNHSVPGSMKNAFDSLGAEWAGKPVAFVGYGAAEGVRAVEHWRQIVANFEMWSVRNQVYLSIFADAADDVFAPQERREREVDTMLADLERLLEKVN